MEKGVLDVAETETPVPDARADTNDGTAVQEGETNDEEMPSVDVDDKEEKGFFDSIGPWNHTGEE